jgi:C-terminal processing protease CtpA/Prc
LKADFDYLRTVIEKAHPSLYRYTPKKSLDSAFEATFVRLNEPMNGLAFWQMLQPIVTKIGCGHTNLFPSANISKIISKRFLIPFYVSIDGDKIFIKRYIQSPGISAYRVKDEILSINGITTAVLLPRLRSFIGSDGLSNAYRDYLLENGDFNKIFVLVYGTENPEFKIVVKRKEVVLETKISSVVTPFSFKPLRVTSKTDLPKVSVIDDLPKTAFLRFSNFVYKNPVQVHQEIFTTIEKSAAENLIIDVRNNPGGSSLVMVDLMKHLLRKDFYFSKRTEGMVDFNYFMNLFKQKDPPDLAALKALESKAYEKDFTGNLRQSPYGNAFKGKIYLLTDGGTFSSASLLVSALRTQAKAIVIGEETGGGGAGCNGGAMVDIVLPNTGLRLKLPIMWTYAVTKLPNVGKGAIPDFFVKSEISKIDTAGYSIKDPLVAKVSQLILH